MIRSSAAALLLLASGGAAAQAWHGPGSPTAPPQPEIESAGGGPQVELGRAIAVKFANPAFAAARAQRGRLPPDSYPMAEERPVREARDRLVRARRAPPGAKVLLILNAAVPPLVDGVVEEAEWRNATHLMLEPARRGAKVMLLASGGRLYLAAIAPKDRTVDGFDQFRFWYHVELSPFFENERAMLTGRGGGVRTLRGVRLPRAGQPIRDGLDPRTLKQDTDWGVHGRLRGASKVAEYRQYEMSVDLEEAGIFPGVPFAAFLEVEGDPLYEGGQFKERVLEGSLGSASSPVWLQLVR